MIESFNYKHYDRDLIPSGGLVFDVGALGGLFALHMIGFGYKVIAFEPDDEGFSKLPQNTLITPVKKAIGYPAGKRTFYSYAPGSGANGFYLNESMEKNYPSTKIEVDVITLEDAVNTYGNPDLLKINAEGAEVEIIMNTPDSVLKSIKQMSISFHAFCGFITEKQEEDCRQRLSDLGYSVSMIQNIDAPEDCLVVKL